MIQGEKVIIRGLKAEDKELIYKWVNQKDIRDLTGTVYPVSECEHDNWFEKMCLDTEQKVFSIEWEGKCVGTIGLKNIDRINSVAEIYVRIGDPETRNHGLGTDAVKTFTDYCFNHLNFHKIALSVYASNQGAIKAYEKAGFVKEGILRQHHYHDGKYEDVIVMGKIRA